MLTKLFLSLLLTVAFNLPIVNDQPPPTPQCFHVYLPLAHGPFKQFGLPYTRSEPIPAACAPTPTPTQVPSSTPTPTTTPTASATVSLPGISRPSAGCIGLSRPGEGMLTVGIDVSRPGFGNIDHLEVNVPGGSLILNYDYDYSDPDAGNIVFFAPSEEGTGLEFTECATPTGTPTSTATSTSTATPTPTPTASPTLTPSPTGFAYTVFYLEKGACATIYNPSETDHPITIQSFNESDELIYSSVITIDAQLTTTLYSAANIHPVILAPTFFEINAFECPVVATATPTATPTETSTPTPTSTEEPLPTPTATATETEWNYVFATYTGCVRFTNPSETEYAIVAGYLSTNNLEIYEPYNKTILPGSNYQANIPSGYQLSISYPSYLTVALVSCQS